MITYVFPGQGSQSKGMGGTLFDEFPEITAKADAILGYSIKNLCLEDPMLNLSQTQFTQPALYTVNALIYLKKIKETARKPDFLAGHSLGEYDALFAAGAFDFETGLKLVQKRGELMGHATGGGMAAIIGLTEPQIRAVLAEHHLTGIDIANLNSPFQIVISGPKDEVNQAQPIFEENPRVRMFAPLKTSGAFHSRYMEAAQNEFAGFLKNFHFSETTIPVISNVQARPYNSAALQQNLLEQITHPVQWTESIRYLMGIGEMEFEELGPGKVLTGLIQRIKKEAEPLVIPQGEIEAVLKKGHEIPPFSAVQTPAPEVSASSAALTEPEDTGASSAKESSNSTFGEVVTKAVKNVQEKAKVLVASTEETIGKVAKGAKGKKANAPKEPAKRSPGGFLPITPGTLGSSGFKTDYGLKYAYITGGMRQGIASPEMVVKVAKAGMLGFLGTGGLELSEIEATLKVILKKLSPKEAYGLNLLHNPYNPGAEERLVELCLAYGVKNMEAGAFLSITPALVRYHTTGLTRGKTGKVTPVHKIIAKVSRPEMAEAFLSPAPERILAKLLAENKITPEEAELAKEIPLADDLCVEADSGGHTEGGVAYALIPAFIRLRDELMKKYHYSKQVRVGAAGGIGTPEAAAAAFILGADFILTGSINQCTVEAATSAAVKDLLQQMNVQDTGYAPADDMFELGAKVQVLKKGLFFPARANKLYDLYRQYNSIDEIDEKTRVLLQEKYFKKSFEAVYQDIKARHPLQEIERAERNPKQKMALIFRWYFEYSSRLALSGTEESKVDYQVHCGPALGAFNQWVSGTQMEDWRNRHVDQIGEKIMMETAEILSQRFQKLVG